MYKVAICNPSSYYDISGTLFPTSGGRPALPVPSPAAISLLLTSLGTTPGPLVGPARPTCNYPFLIPTIIKAACCAADLGSIHQTKCGKSKFRGAPIMVCTKIGVGPQTLMHRIVAGTGPICAPLPPLLHYQHKFRSAISTS
jgi:hypothetical protein